MKNSNDIGNRTRDLPACSAVLQPTAPMCTTLCNYDTIIYLQKKLKELILHKYTYIINFKLISQIINDVK